jgi:hypothetical protein
MKIHLIGFLEFLGLYVPLCLMATMTIYRQFTDSPLRRGNPSAQAKNHGEHGN